MSAPPSRLRPLAEADLACVRAWRNAPEVRLHMFTTHEIGAEEHQRWFERHHADPTRRLLVFEAGGTPQGFVHFSGVAPGGIAEWGFYAAPDAPRGTGSALGQAALDHAFRVEALHKVCGQALAGNAASIRFHRKMGFREEGVLRQQHRDAAGRHHDIHCFGLLQPEWRAVGEDAIA